MIRRIGPAPRAAAALVALLAAAHVRAAPPEQPRTAARVIVAAHREGRVVVYSATDRSLVTPLLADFAELHPAITVEYHDIPAREIHGRALAEAAARRGVGDVLWSSAMDLQIQLANDGFAMAYESPETVNLPAWAVWRNEAFATTLEPIVFAYDAARLPAAEVPRSHADLVRLLDAEPPRWRGRVATYDPERSAFGYLLLTQDSRLDPGFEGTLRAYRRAGITLVETSGAMIDGVLSGRDLLAVNVNGSYVLGARRTAPRLALVYPSDYVLATSRIALIPRTAQHPNAAKVFLDYLLSARGQDVLANRCSLFSIRTDVEGEATAAALARTLGARLKPIHVGPSLLVHVDRLKQLEFLRRWRAAAVAP
ncbi:ABC transporter substrate-binding protein [Anaeromyxobacter oryzae]|nr:ABC transporter substrate-binding protein [Anaeromyxobacter oryzae]